MKLLFVADNTSDDNWGCRGTSFALRQLLSRNHEIVGSITRDLLKSPLTASKLLPGSAYQALVHKLRRPGLARVPAAGAAMIGLIDALGTFHAPTLDIEADGETLLTNRDKSPKARQIVEGLEACDAIVVNAEGETIFSTPPRATLLQTLAICAAARRMGKPIYYINGMISHPPDGNTHLPTAKQAEQVLREAKLAVRDEHSIEVAAQLMPSLKPTYFADALFTWIDHFQSFATSRYDASRVAPFFDRTGTRAPAMLEQPFIAISGSSQAAKSQDRAADCYTRLIEGLRELGLPMILVAACNGDRFLATVARRTNLPFLPAETPLLAGAAILANARLFVSGRWHPSIMGSLGGTPAVFMGSNSHKTLSLQHLLGYENPVEYRAFPEEDDVAGIVAKSRALLAEGVDRRERVVAATAELAASARRLEDFVR